MYNFQGGVALSLMVEELEGHIESITYTNEENGYTIARVRVDSHDELITIVGNLVSPDRKSVV